MYCLKVEGSAITGHVEHVASTPKIPIPFNRLLKIVALVDTNNREVRQLLDLLEAERYEVEVSVQLRPRSCPRTRTSAPTSSTSTGRSVTRRANSGSPCARSDFARRIWALADSRKISDVDRLGAIGEVDGFIYLGQQSPAYYAKQIVASVVDYGTSLLPPFFGGMMAYDAAANMSFACPGHQGGQFYRKSPAGQLFYKFFGEQIFRNDLCNADVELGDLLIHVGAAVEAQRNAAQIFGADRTYFVLNGTSTSNKVVTGAALHRDDLVLFDRNNHKSLHQGALVQAGAIPVFLPTARNSFGMIGAVDWDAWDEKDPARAHPQSSARQGQETRRRRAPVPHGLHPARHLRRHGLQRAQGHGEDRPSLRLRAVGRGLDRLQRLPSAVRGPQPHAHREAGPGHAGLFSTQSVHKQGAGFSQASQIHKRDEHIKGQKRFIEHKRFNESFLINASTSPFYPLFASLDVNAKVHEGKAGEMLWDRCIELGIEARKKLREFGQRYAKTGRDAQEKWFFDPFVPDVVTIKGSKFTKDATNVPWESLPTDVLKREQQCWTSIRRIPGTAIRATPKATPWSTPTSSCC